MIKFILTGIERKCVDFQGNKNSDEVDDSDEAANTFKDSIRGGVKRIRTSRSEGASAKTIIKRTVTLLRASHKT
jgi:hypothetical protein